MLSSTHACNIRWTLDGFCHGTLCRYCLWREVPPFWSLEILNNFCTRKLLLKVVDVRTFGCTVGHGQGCTGGAVAGAERELPAGSSAATSWLRWPCGYGTQAAQHNLRATLDVQHRAAQRRPAPAHASCDVDHQLLHVQRYPSQDQYTSWSGCYQHLQFGFALCFHTCTFPFMFDSYQSWCFCFSAVLCLYTAPRSIVWNSVSFMQCFSSHQLKKDMR